MMAVCNAIWGALSTAVHDWHRPELFRARIGPHHTKQFLQALVGPSDVLCTSYVQNIRSQALPSLCTVLQPQYGE